MRNTIKDGYSDMSREIKVEAQNDNTGNVYEVNIDDFCTSDGKYFDFDMLSEAIDSGELKPIRDREEE